MSDLATAAAEHMTALEGWFEIHGGLEAYHERNKGPVGTASLQAVAVARTLALRTALAAAPEPAKAEPRGNLPIGEYAALWRATREEYGIAVWEAINFYAAESNYKPSPTGGGDMADPAVEEDRGAIARAVLAGDVPPWLRKARPAPAHSGGGKAGEAERARLDELERRVTALETKGAGK